MWGFGSVQDLHLIGFYNAFNFETRQEVGFCTWLWVGIVYRVDLAVAGGSPRDTYYL